MEWQRCGMQPRKTSRGRGSISVKGLGISVVALAARGRDGVNRAVWQVGMAIGSVLVWMLRESVLP